MNLYFNYYRNHSALKNHISYLDKNHILWLINFQPLDIVDYQNNLFIFQQSL